MINLNFKFLDLLKNHFKNFNLKNNKNFKGHYLSFKIQKKYCKTVEKTLRNKIY